MNRTTIIGLSGLVLIVAALGLNIWFNSDVPEDQDMVAPIEGAAINTPPVAKKITEPSDEVSTAKSTVPDFDVVRISKEGDTVMAGRAPAGSTVVVMDGDDELGRVIADGSGEWVFLPEKSLEAGNREISLRAETIDGKITESENLVLLAVPERNSNSNTEAERPLAVLVPKAGGVSRTLQKPVDAMGVEAEAGGLVIDSIDYDEAGNVTISGRGVAGAQVRGYLNNSVLDTTKVTEDKVWAMTPSRPIAPGVYTLRLDQLIGNKVVSRLEIPFNRAEPLENLGNGSFIVVQPGSSLWRIARKTLGDGFSYTHIYNANKKQIRNPDLIYPGQVFQIPESTN